MKPVEAALLAKARALRPKQRLRLPTPPRTRFPTEIERQYFKELQKEVISRLEEISRKEILAQVPSLLSEAKDSLPTLDSSASIRRDSYTRSIELIFNGMRLKFAAELTDREILAIAQKIASKGEQFNKTQVGDSLRKVLAINPISAEPYLDPIMRQFIDQNTQLIKSISQEYFDKLQQDTYQYIQQGVYNREYAGKIQSEFSEEFRRQYEKGILQRRVNNASARAQLIARDQISKYNGQLNQTRQTALGISKYRWSTSGDDRVRDSHKRNNGKVFSWDNPPATGHPGDDINCRCVAIPLFDVGVTDNPELLKLLNA